MSAIKVALAHIGHPRHLHDRMIGAWGYDVPEFEVEHINLPKTFDIDRADLAGFDVIVHEDSKTRGTWRGAGPHVWYHVVDSTLSDEHFNNRHEQAKQADYLLIDWDDLARFSDTGKPAFRWSYCVNDRIFKPAQKTHDVAFVYGKTDDRIALDRWLQRYCEMRGYSYVSGSRYGDAYPAAIASARVNINLNRNPQTRAHRCFDVMASHSALLTSPLPDVDEPRAAELHYTEWYDKPDLGRQLDRLIGDGEWQQIADAGYSLVQEHYTWKVRAAQLAALMLGERINA